MSDAPETLPAASYTRPGLPDRVDLAPRTEQSVLLDVITRAATDPQFDLDRVERLLTMHQKLVERQAEREFTQAMARFKANPPTIVKDRRARIPHKDGGGVTEYSYASLGAICEAAIRGLAAVDISHRWDVKRENARIIVTCVLTHAAGHSVGVTMDAAPDDSGRKNAIQQSASAVTYLQKYTLLAVTGLATEEDDDGRGAGDGETLDETQVADLRALMQEVGSTELSFLKYMQVAALEEIPKASYSACVAALESKRRR